MPGANRGWKRASDPIEFTIWRTLIHSECWEQNPRFSAKVTSFLNLSPVPDPNHFLTLLAANCHFLRHLWCLRLVRCHLDVLDSFCHMTQKQEAGLLCPLGMCHVLILGMCSLNGIPKILIVGPTSVTTAFLDCGADECEWNGSVNNATPQLHNYLFYRLSNEQKQPNS